MSRVIACLSSNMHLRNGSCQLTLRFMTSTLFYLTVLNFYISINILDVLTGGVKLPSYPALFLFPFGNKFVYNLLFIYYKWLVAVWLYVYPWVAVCIFIPGVAVCLSLCGCMFVV